MTRQEIENRLLMAFEAGQEPVSKWNSEGNLYLAACVAKGGQESDAGDAERLAGEVEELAARLKSLIEDAHSCGGHRVATATMETAMEALRDAYWDAIASHQFRSQDRYPKDIGVDCSMGSASRSSLAKGLPTTRWGD